MEGVGNAHRIDAGMSLARTPAEEARVSHPRHTIEVEPRLRAPLDPSGDSAYRRPPDRQDLPFRRLSRTTSSYPSTAYRSRTAEKAERLPSSHSPPVIIDEVQYAPGVFRYLKSAVDASRTRYGQFLLTSSQKFTLMNSISESLAGRADIVEMETLSWAEIRAALPQTVLESVIVRAASPSCTPTLISIWSPSTTLIWQPIWSAMCGPWQRWQLARFERFLRACALHPQTC